MSVSDETLNLAAAQRRALAALLNSRSDDLVRLWVAAWEEIANELDRAIEALTRGVSVSRKVRYRQAAAAYDVVSRQLVAVTAQAGAVLTADARTVIEGALQGQARLLATQLPPPVTAGLVRVDEGQIAEMVARTGEQITKATYFLSTEATAGMKRELVRSTAVGENPKVAASRMVAAVQGVFNGGLARALVIGRTEILDAHRRAAQSARVANRDVVDGWRWMCDLSSRACPACVGMHGTIHPVDEFGPAGHQQCRCVALPVTKSWADLGFRGVDEPADSFPDADRWFDALPESEQRNLLGPARYEAWQSGGYPRDRWATVRHTDGWRDSYIPSPAPVAG